MIILPTRTVADAQALQAAFQVTEPDDGGNLDLSASTLTEESMTLVPRPAPNESGSASWSDIQFKIEGAVGLTPTFSISFDGANNAAKYPVWSYTRDREDWHEFDNTSGSGERTFSNNAPFTQDVYIGMRPREMVTDYYTRITTDFIARTYVEAPAGGGADGNAFQIGTQGAVTSAEMGAACARDFPGLPLYAAVVSESARNPDKLVVVISGQHPYEHQNKWALQGWFDFATSEDTAAQTYRDHFVTLFCFHVNPGGEWIGIWRGYPEDTSLDPNREWRNDSLDFIAAHKGAIESEIAARSGLTLAGGFDLHQGLISSGGFAFGPDTTEVSNYMTEVAGYIPGTSHNASSTGSDRGRGYLDDLGFAVPITLERTTYNDYSTEHQVGEYYARALVDRAEAGDYDSP